MVRWIPLAAAACGVVGAAFAAEKGGGKSDRGSSPAAIVPTPTAPAKAAPTGEATTTRFGDWAWVCRPSTSAPPSCEGTQLLRRSGDGSDLAQYRLTPTNDAAVLRLSVLVPANARMDSPPRLVRGGDPKDVAGLKWIVCTLGGCRAEADVRLPELEALSRGTPDGTGVTYLDASARTVALPMVTNGLTDLIKAAVSKGK